MDTIILGAGLAGLSAANFLNFNNIIFEKKNYAGGHINSEVIDGFTWDEGPHVSFTKNEIVKEVFEFNADNKILEYEVKPGNYFEGNWIPHPAQTNLFAVPNPLKDACLKDLLDSRVQLSKDIIPQNYGEWLNLSFGKTFSKAFPYAYTKKYWTTEPENLTTNWIGERVHFPNIEQVKEGYLGPLKHGTHYIQRVRYPESGGYISFAKKMIESANIKLNHDISFIDFDKNIINFTNGYKTKYKRIISTIPLPLLIEKSNAPTKVKNSSKKLSCTSVLLVNVVASHPTQRFENWIYVYDEKKYSTRINCTELLSKNNAPEGKTGIQVEVYFSKYKPLVDNIKNIADKVCDELIEMKLIKDKDAIETINTKWVDWANIIFDREREEAQNEVLNWLEKTGLKREPDDLEPMTNWGDKLNTKLELGNLILAGRYAQWKYYWTDDCVLRGLYISKCI
ncbi:protoporphyrinogen/coproporphyrinogen oxidase [Spirosoma gilvum]